MDWPKFSKVSCIWIRSALRYFCFAADGVTASKDCFGRRGVSAIVLGSGVCTVQCIFRGQNRILTTAGDSVPEPLRFIRWEISGRLEKTATSLPLSLPFYLTACVGSLLSVALFGCDFSIVLLYPSNPPHLPSMRLKQYNKLQATP